MKVNNYTLFPTIVSHVECDNFNSIKNDLIDWIYNYQQNNEGPIVSNRGGWQSYNNFYHDSTFSPFLEYIDYHIKSAVKFYNIDFAIKELWININKPGDYNLMHHHHRLLSGVFWITAPQNCGNMNLISPNSYSDAMFHRNVDADIAEKYKYVEQCTFIPEEGSMLFFPSSMNHSVDENQSNSDRISLTFNLDEI